MKTFALVISLASVAVVLSVAAPADAGPGFLLDGSQFSSVVRCGDGYGITCGFNTTEENQACTNDAMIECYAGHDGVSSIDWYLM
jgi:hypothetical protein